MGDGALTLLMFSELALKVWFERRRLGVGTGFLALLRLKKCCKACLQGGHYFTLHLLSEALIHLYLYFLVAKN